MIFTYQTKIDVKFDGKKIGVIVELESGWQYWPQGKKKYAGDIYPTLDEVKASIY